MTRLAARQRLQREGGAVRRLRERETVAFRRALYRSGTRVRGVAGAGHQGQQQRDITADSFRRNPVHLNRLRPWLRRELTVLYGAHGSLVDIVQRIIVARLARHGLEDTPTIEEELRQFLLARTDHFLHELVSFARSPLGLDDYDLQAVYEPPDAAAAQPDAAGSSDSSSVIAISEGEGEERRAASAHDDVIQTGSNLSLAAWDDETPGPSYSSAEPSCSLASLLFSPAPPEPANEEAGEECLIVGYKKPIAERTPELVQLSSDTEEEKEEELPPLSSLPTIPPSTSAHRDGEPTENDGEPAERRSPSGSSGRSGNSVCSLSPATPPGESERRERASGRELRERRRRRRRRGRKSGTLYNPNRSIFPAMMRRRSHSPSPFLSSVDSGSPLPPSPSDSTWEYHCSQLSPLPSSASSPSSSSSSPLCSSPQTPPTPSLSPGDAAAAAAAAHHREKPGGKRKYKSRHLDSSDKDPTWRPSGAGEGGRREGGRARRRDGSRRCRDDRSPSVEIIYEGTINATQTAAHKHRRKRHRKTQHSSPVIITLDSDSSHDNNKNNHTTTTSCSRLLLSSSSSSSSPLSSQQTVDFSDLPPLALHSAGVGGALNAEIGDELPADILDRGSDGSETEAAGPIAVDNSDQDVDAESVGESGVLLQADTTTAGSEPVGTAETDRAHRGASEVVTSDSRLLAAILSDLKGTAAPNRSSDTGRRLRDPCEVGRAHSDQDGWSAETRHPGFPEEEHRPLRTSAPPLPPLGWLKEGKDVPPLLKQASPVRSYNRNTPPPLKHKDAGSPHRFPVSPADEPRDHQAIPSISTLKRSFTSAFGVRSPDHKPPIDPHSFTNSADFFPRLNFNSPHSHKSHSRRDSSGTRSSPILSLSPVGLHHSDSTSGGCRNNRTLNSTDLHPTEGTPAGSGVLSGANCNDASPADRTQTPSSSSTADEHPGRPKSPVDFHSPEHKPPSVNHEENHTAASSSPTQPHNHIGPSSDPPFDPCSKHNPPVDPHPPADNHITSSPRPVDNRWKSNASIDARSEARTPLADERSAGGVWNTHTHSAT